MVDVRQGRWTAQIEGDFVVFVIGARLNWRHPVRSFKDLGGMQGMPYMLKHLSERPDSGLLAYENYGLTTYVQYWRSFEDLERFANAEDEPHKPVWRNYWRRLGRDPRTGIWHETYLVRAGEYEAVYGNMAPHGLARAGRPAKLTAGSAARSRVKGLTRGSA
jgi:Domain of unknown function (DUF4188)